MRAPWQRRGAGEFEIDDRLGSGEQDNEYTNLGLLVGPGKGGEGIGSSPNCRVEGFHIPALTVIIKKTS